MKGVDYWMSCGGAPSPDKTRRLFSTGRGKLKIRARTLKVCVADQSCHFRNLFFSGVGRPECTDAWQPVDAMCLRGGLETTAAFTRDGMVGLRALKCAKKRKDKTH